MSQQQNTACVLSIIPSKRHFGKKYNKHETSYIFAIIYFLPQRYYWVYYLV